MRKALTLSCVLLSVMMVIGFVGIASAVDTSGIQGEILFIDSFDSQKDDWTLEYGTIVIAGKMMFMEKARAYTDLYVEEVGMRFDIKGTGVFNISFHNLEPGAFSATGYDKYGYVLWIDQKKPQIIKPTQDRTAIHWMGMHFEYDEGISISDDTLTFEVIKQRPKETNAENSSHWTIKINGKVVFDQDTPARDNPAHEGYLGFFAFEGRWEIDNLVIFAPSGE